MGSEDDLLTNRRISFNEYVRVRFIDGKVRKLTENESQTGIKSIMKLSTSSKENSNICRTPPSLAQRMISFSIGNRYHSCETFLRNNEYHHWYKDEEHLEKRWNCSKNLMKEVTEKCKEDHPVYIFAHEQFHIYDKIRERYREVIKNQENQAVKSMEKRLLKNEAKQRAHLQHCIEQLQTAFLNIEIRSSRDSAKSEEVDNIRADAELIELLISRFPDIAKENNINL